MKTNIYEILFWIFLSISLFLLAWYIVGDSPTEFTITISLIVTLMLKVWSISDRQIRSEMRFNALAKDFKEHVGHK